MKKKLKEGYEGGNRASKPLDFTNLEKNWKKRKLAFQIAIWQNFEF